MRQTSFGFMKGYKKEFGGFLLLGNRKSKRPLSTKHPIHLILKADQKGVFNPSSQKLNSLIRKTARLFNIQIYDLAVNWSHIHFLIRFKQREDYVKFVRAVSSLLTEFSRRSDSIRSSGKINTQTAQRRDSKSQIRKLFTLRPFTRILAWGRDLKSVFNYLKIDQMESFGLICKPKLKKIGKPPN
jgi:REP element-mobilizing transposase RayT